MFQTLKSSGKFDNISCKGKFLSESTDVLQTFFFPKTENLNFGDFMAAQNKLLSFQTLRHPQFISKFKFSVSGKNVVFLFGVLTKTSVSSEKKGTFARNILTIKFTTTFYG